MLEHASGSILFKRAAGDSENRDQSNAHTSVADKDWQTRFTIFIKTIGIVDVIPEASQGYGGNSSNVYPVLHSNKYRLVAIDPMFGKSVNDYYLNGLSGIISESFSPTDQEIKALQKLTYFYKLNKDKIDPVITALDDQYRLAAENHLSDKMDGHKRDFDELELDKERKEELLAQNLSVAQGQMNGMIQNLPSLRLTLLMNAIEASRTSFEQAHPQEKPITYSPKPDGKYVSRNIDTALDESTVRLVVDALREKHPTLLREDLSGTVVTYAAKGTGSESTFDYRPLTPEKGMELFTKINSCIHASGDTTSPNKIHQISSNCTVCKSAEGVAISLRIYEQQERRVTGAPFRQMNINSDGKITFGTELDNEKCKQLSEALGFLGEFKAATESRPAAAGGHVATLVKNELLGEIGKILEASPGKNQGDRKGGQIGRSKTQGGKCCVIS